MGRGSTGTAFAGTLAMAFGCEEPPPEDGPDAPGPSDVCAEGEVDDRGTCVPEECGTGLLVSESRLEGFGGAAVFLDGSSASLEGLDFVYDTLPLVDQECSEAAQPEGADEIVGALLCPTCDLPVHPLALDASVADPVVYE